MHRTATRSLALRTLVLVVVVRTAAAQSPATPAGAPRTPGTGPAAINILWAVPSLTTTDRERLDATIGRADTLMLNGKIAEATRLYWSVVSEQHAAEEYPVTALRRLANMYANVGDDNSAASVLMELAALATDFGDPATRLQSLFDAALVYRDMGRTDRALECVRQIRPLLKAVVIPEAVRAEISNRIVVR